MLPHSTLSLLAQVRANGANGTSPRVQRRPRSARAVGAPNSVGTSERATLRSTANRALCNSPPLPMRSVPRRQNSTSSNSASSCSRKVQVPTSPPGSERRPGGSGGNSSSWGEGWSNRVQAGSGRHASPWRTAGVGGLVECGWGFGPHKMSVASIFVEIGARTTMALREPLSTKSRVTDRVRCEECDSAMHGPGRRLGTLVWSSGGAGLQFRRNSVQSIWCATRSPKLTLTAPGGGWGV